MTQTTERAERADLLEHFNREHPREWGQTAGTWTLAEMKAWHAGLHAGQDKPGTDWPAFAADLLSGDPERLRARMPEWLRDLTEPKPEPEAGDRR